MNRADLSLAVSITGPALRNQLESLNSEPLILDSIDLRRLVRQHSRFHPLHQNLATHCRSKLDTSPMPVDSLPLNPLGSDRSMGAVIRGNLARI